MVLYLIVHKDCFMVDFCYLGEGGGKAQIGKLQHNQ